MAIEANPIRSGYTNTYERRAVHKLPRRPFPASEFEPHKPVARATWLIPTHKEFPGFWSWLGKSRVVWFVVELPPAIARAWKDARRHSHVMFPEGDEWTL